MEAVVQTHLGNLKIIEEAGALIQLSWVKEAPFCPSSALLSWAARQLTAYFQGDLRRFDVPMAPRGTAFEQTVWRQLLLIPYGETVSYAQLAAHLGNPNACRAVGQANGRNPLPILIPCHRVIAADGSLGGYAHGLAAKQALLDLEAKHRSQ